MRNGIVYRAPYTDCETSPPVPDIKKMSVCVSASHCDGDRSPVRNKVVTMIVLSAIN
jgi:hypothetical protein